MKHRTRTNITHRELAKPQPQPQPQPLPPATSFTKQTSYRRGAGHRQRDKAGGPRSRESEVRDGPGAVVERGGYHRSRSVEVLVQSELGTLVVELVGLKNSEDTKRGGEGRAS